MSVHFVSVEQTDKGFLARCSCGDRDMEFHEHVSDAQDWGLEHEQKARQGVRSMNYGARISPAVMARHYRQMAEHPTTGEQEARVWRSLASEIEDITPRIAKKQPEIEGQMGLFD